MHLILDLNTMAHSKRKTIILNNKTYTLDPHGFLYPPDQWDHDFAEGIAKILGIYHGLTEEHWSFIDYLRNKFIIEKTVPLVVYACTDNKIRLSKFRRLFPTGYHRGACKIAGINYKFMFKTNHWLTYEPRSVLSKKYKMTSTGFLSDFNSWTEDFAHFVVGEWKLSEGLTDTHKKIIHYLRDYYETTETIPTIFETCGATGVTFKDIRKLFPEGYRRGACRIAGLPFFS